jgi:hypothetical protein
MACPPYPAAGPVGSSPLLGQPWSGMFSDWPGGLYATPTISGSRAGGVIAATWAAMVRYVLRLVGRFLRHAHHIRQPGRWGHCRYLGCHGQVCSLIGRMHPRNAHHIRQPGGWGHSRYLGRHGQVCSLIGQVVSMLRSPYPAVEPVGSSPLPGLPWSGMLSDWPSGICATSTIYGSRAGGVIAATWAAMVMYALRTGQTVSMAHQGGHHRYLGCHGQVCSLTGRAVLWYSYNIGSRAGGVIAATWAAMVRYVL